MAQPHDDAPPRPLSVYRTPRPGERLAFILTADAIKEAALTTWESGQNDLTVHLAAQIPLFHASGEPATPPAMTTYVRIDADVLFDACRDATEGRAIPWGTHVRLWATKDERVNVVQWFVG